MFGVSWDTFASLGIFLWMIIVVVIIGLLWLLAPFILHGIVALIKAIISIALAPLGMLKKETNAVQSAFKNNKRKFN